jgi:DNA-binding LytR/AlgR family response regulator
MQEFFYVRKNARYEQVKFSELLFVKAMRGYMQLVTESQVYFVLNTIEEVQKYLPKELFCRTHRSYLVSIQRITAFDQFKLSLRAPPEGRQYSPGLSSITELPVGKAYRKNLRNSISIIPNRMNKNVKRIVTKAAFLLECQLEED